MSRIGLQLALGVLDALADGGPVNDGVLASVIAGLSPLVEREPSSAEQAAIELLTSQLSTSPEAAATGEEPAGGDSLQASSPSPDNAPSAGDTSSSEAGNEEAVPVPPSPPADLAAPEETASPVHGPEQVEEPSADGLAQASAPDSPSLPVS